MRKYIIPLFLSLCPTIAPAITNAECKQSYIDHNQMCTSTGCGYYNNECVACPAGTYQHQTLALEDLLLGEIRGKECNSCTYPWQFDEQSITWTWDKSKTGMDSPDNCTIHVHIPKGHELIEKQNFSKYTVQKCADKHYKTNDTTLTYTLESLDNPYPAIPNPADGQIPDAKCTPCGNNANHNADHTNCNCEDWYYTGDDHTNTKNIGNQNCIPITYNATYSNGSNTLPNDKIPSGYTKIGPKYPLTLPEIQCGCPDISNLLTCLCMSKTGYNFATKWTANRKLTVQEPGKPLTETNKNTPIMVGASVNSHTDDPGDVIFTAQWTPKIFTVTYNAVNCDQQTQTCTYDSPCYIDNPNKCSDTTQGKYITHWTCTNGCTNTSTQYYVGDNISNISNGNNMTLTAEWSDCPSGYYCSNGEINPCPAGSTSDQGATDITNCYIGKDTQFCHGDACFTIPDLEIFYSSK